MALPKLNTEPKYRITIPSTGKQTRFRPYLVKEEKVLMLAMESKDEKQILDAVADTIVACVEETIDKRQLTPFDIEFLFTKIRSKSVGEVVHLNMKCTECTKETPVDINVDDIAMPVKKPQTMIDITDDIQLEMKWPTLEGILRMQDDHTTENMLAMLRVAMVAVHTQDERIDLTESTDAEIEEFLESMNNNQFGKIREFMDNMPSLKHTVDFKCGSCGHENSILLEGMQSFF